MADETTPRLNLVKPEVGGSADTWGDKWNENADKIDAAIIRLDEENVWSAPQHFDGGLYDDGERVVRPSDFSNLDPGTQFIWDTPAGDRLGIVAEVSAGVSHILFGDANSGGPNRTYIRVYGPSDASFPGAALVVAGGSTQTKISSDGVAIGLSGVPTFGPGTLNAANGLYDGGERVVRTSRTISTGTGLTGGGNLSANRTISLASSHYPIGVGQTWQDMTSQRATGVNYTNTTGRTIFVAAGDDTSDLTSNLELVVDGEKISGFAVGGGSAISKNITVSGLVPPGSIYRINRLEGGKGITWWKELR